MIADYIKECYRIMKDDTAMYLFCSMDKVDLFKIEIEKYFTLKNIIVWVKKGQTMGDLEAQYGKQYEFIMYANKGRRPINGKRISDVWHFDRTESKTQDHQNQKPLTLIQRCINNHSNEGDIVFDGFAGSGTTAVASLLLKRRYIAIELLDKYCDIINRRLEEISMVQPLFGVDIL